MADKDTKLRLGKKQSVGMSSTGKIVAGAALILLALYMLKNIFLDGMRVRYIGSESSLPTVIVLFGCLLAAVGGIGVIRSAFKDEKIAFYDGGMMIDGEPLLYRDIKEVHFPEGQQGLATIWTEDGRKTHCMLLPEEDRVGREMRRKLMGFVTNLPEEQLRAIREDYGLGEGE